MSGYPGSRSRRPRRNTAHNEPLLLSQQNRSRHGGGAPARIHHSQRQRGASGGVELIDFGATAPTYRPPHSLSDLPIVDAEAVHESVPRQRQQRQQQRQQYPHHPVQHRNLLAAAEEFNVNPARDLAIPCFSHGCCCCQCVRTQEIGFSEQCGEFQEILGPGLHCMLWPFNSIGGRLTLRVQQLDVVCETKTSDHVFVRIHIVVLFRVAVVQAYEAYYRLSDPRIQIETYVLDVVRSAVPGRTLDEVFASKHEIAETLLLRLHQGTRQYGYEITETLVTDVIPNDIVKAAMNEVNASRRIKDAAPYKADALRIGIIKEAEGRVEARFLSGVGTANQRRAIAQGLKETVEVWTDDVRLVMPAKDVMDILLVSQYFDVLNAVGSKGSNSSMILK
jgi:regulator of protease activity HflC (stomatin/prohibitin superfamily)